MKIIQIIPAPANLFYAFDKETALPAICLALVEAESGDREIRVMGLTNGEFIEDVQEAGALLLNERKDNPLFRGNGWHITAF